MELNIYAYKCQRCGHVQYPYRTICKKCGENDHNEFDPLPLATKGKLITYTHLYTLPADYEIKRLTLGIIELEDGNKITGQLNIQEPVIGMTVKGKVQVVRQELYEKRLGMVFYEV